MEITLIFSLISSIIAIISVILAITTFVTNRKDKAVKDAKEMNIGLIDYRLNELDKNVQKILIKLDNYESEIDIRIDKAIKQHIDIYHTHHEREQ